jgi:FKBP-type peptidyl-prolyl cis-trans isomerase
MARLLLSKPKSAPMRRAPQRGYAMSRLRLTCSAAVLALGLAACGGGSDEAEPEAPGADTQDAGQDSAAPAEAVVQDPGPSEAVRAILADARACGPAPAAMAFETGEPAEGQAQASFNAAVSQRFLAENADRDCVFELPSGLQFTIVTAVEDAPSPTSGELVRVDYEGRLVSGEIFDSSYERGESAVFPSDRLISGWVEALPLMRVGEEWTLFIAPELGYGQRGTPNGPIGPNQALIFKIELLGLPGRGGDDG